MFCLLLSGAASAAAPQRFLVEFNDFERGKSEVRGLGGAILLELAPQRALAVMLPEAAIDALGRNPNVVVVEADPLRHPLAQVTPYGIPLVQADQVWPLTGGANRTVCVIDSGLSVSHEDLQRTNVSGYPSTWNRDACGHGTHVTGTIAALDNTLGVVGVLPDGVRLFIVKVFGDDCRWTYASTLIDAANRCKTAGANVISMSLGGRFKSTTEERAFAELYSRGLLSVAAAGNDGSSRYSYPASYDAVISVGALDSNQNIASFSQRNDQVELAAPGVAVRSTVSWLDDNSVRVDDVSYVGGWLTGAARSAGVTGALVDGGLCDSVGSWSGRVVLCRRGNSTFYSKVSNVERGGGAGAIVYNNVAGDFSGTLGDGNSSRIPAISLSKEDGERLVTKVGGSATLRSVYESPGSGYESWQGTSMATPHVAGVAALIWSDDTRWTNVQLREALRSSAKDLGASGRDSAYGYGLVQAKRALDTLRSGNGGGGGSDAGTDPTPGTILLQVRAYKVKGLQRADLTWSGATSTNVEIFRDGSLIARVAASDGAYTDAIGKKGPGSYAYAVCEQGTATCSDPVTATF